VTSISVLVPTYRRAGELRRCLAALEQQTRTPNQIVVVAREGDTDTWSAMRDHALGEHPPGILPLTTVAVSRAGVVAAINAGLDVTTGDIVALTDDDAAPHPDWLEQIEVHFRDAPNVGAVGGRDWIFNDGVRHEGCHDVVGRLAWVGRLQGNHHLGCGPPRYVDVLKGVNFSIRRAAIAGLRLDERLRGSGAQDHWEIALSLDLADRGWKLLYDPAVAVDHFLGPRYELSRKSTFTDLASHYDASYNETVALWAHLTWPRRLAFGAWSLTIGTRDAPGLVQAVRWTRSLRLLAWRRVATTIRARLAAVRFLANSRR
jgi:cellulose synthase/poly-beta-1,6-N-acetylglucosamine synthase-like glycosyltransferase